MKLIAVTRIRNECDLVEPFVRHHARLVDRHIFLDNGSNDGTLETLRALHASGLNLSVYSTSSGTVAEAQQNTRLLRLAASEGADWIIHLDCDEFIDPVCLLNQSLHAALEAVPAQAPCVHTEAINYHPTCYDDVNERVVPRRITWRDTNRADFVKVFVRGSAVSRGVTTGAGNHDAFFRGTKLPAFTGPAFRLGHFYMRSGWQILAKSVVGLSKVYASGQDAIRENQGGHYTQVFENLRDHPEWLLENAHFLNGTSDLDYYQGDLIDDAIVYLGGDLVYTDFSRSPMANCFRSILSGIEAIARRHGELADATVRTREMTDAWAAEFLPLF